MVWIPKLRRNGDGRLFAVYPKSNGKREYFGKQDDPEAERKYRQWLSRVLNGATVPKGKDILVVDLVQAYLGWAESEYGRDSKEFSLIWNALDRLLDMAASLPAQELGPKLLTAYQNRMLSETYQRTPKSSPRQYSQRTIKVHSDWIKRMVRWACQEELIPAEMWMKLQAVQLPRKAKERKREVRPVSWKTVKATLPHLNSPVAEMVQVQWYCGMRPGEVRLMTPADVEQSGDVWLYTPGSHKNAHRGHPLVKAIPKPAQAILASLEPSEAHLPYFDASRAARRDRKSRPYGEWSYYHAVKRGCKRAKVATWTPNQLRHGIATAIKEKFGREAAQKYLGHANLDTTA
ncbi:MAG: tyrosine-type recombinase/integrase, partial [Maioricimonas sp. JB049]